jgi:putative transposase
MPKGCLSLVAIIEWWRRDGVSWPLAHPLDSPCCLAALDQALGRGGPEIFTTDHGGQCTSLAFPSRLAQAGIAISMDGRGRALDNIFVARLGRTVKYEDLDLKDEATVPTLQAGLEHSCRFSNQERPHQSLAYRTPEEVHREP